MRLLATPSVRHQDIFAGMAGQSNKPIAFVSVSVRIVSCCACSWTSVIRHSSIVRKSSSMRPDRLDR